MKIYTSILAKASALAESRAVLLSFLESYSKKIKGFNDSDRYLSGIEYPPSYYKSQIGQQASSLHDEVINLGLKMGGRRNDNNQYLEKILLATMKSVRKAIKRRLKEIDQEIEALASQRVG